MEVPEELRLWRPYPPRPIFLGGYALKSERRADGVLSKWSSTCLSKPLTTCISRALFRDIFARDQQNSL